MCVCVCVGKGGYCEYSVVLSRIIFHYHSSELTLFYKATIMSYEGFNTHTLMSGLNPCYGDSFSIITISFPFLLHKFVKKCQKVTGPKRVHNFIHGL